MTERDRQPFAELLLAVGETYGEPVSDGRLEIYFRALCDLPIDAIRRACDVHVRHGKFFPRPVEIREAVEGNLEDRAEVAWMAVRALVRRYGYPGIDGKGKPPEFPDEATRRAAMELYGGWQALCELLPSAGPELLGTRKMFVAGFASHQRVSDRVMPPSREEATQLLGSVKRELAARSLPTGNL